MRAGCNWNRNDYCTGVFEFGESAGDVDRRDWHGYTHVSVSGTDENCSERQTLFAKIQICRLVGQGWGRRSGGKDFRTYHFEHLRDSRFEICA